MSSDNIYTIECKSLSELPGSIDELSKILIEHVIPEQNKSENDWEIIRVEIWEDSGRFIVFPAARIFEKRTDVSAAQIICNEIKQHVDAIDYSELSDNESDKEIDALVMKMAAIFKKNMPNDLKFIYELYRQNGDKIAI